MATKLITGKNDLKTINPLLAKDWHPTKNGNLFPTMVTAGSSKKIWWSGSCGHEWPATIASRNSGTGCPVCARKNIAAKIRRASILKNGSLAETNPSLAKEWNTDKNDTLKPDSISANSHEIVWWKCNKGHEWQAIIKARNMGYGCPYCSGREIIPGINDLETSNPELAAEWNTEKNNTTPNQVSRGSHKLMWWKCIKGHEWQATIKSRSRGSRCPYCSGKALQAGINSLAALYPDIIEEWNYERNGDLTPDAIRPGSHVKVWWKCSAGHEWQASPNHRVSKRRNCPYCCHNPKVQSGVNDLATCHPDLAAEWNYIQNGELTPENVTANSRKSVWWVCNKGHGWKTAVNHRANGSGCPYCSSAMQTSFPEQAIYYYVHMAYADAKNGYTELFNNHGMELDVFIPSLAIGIEYDGTAFHRTQKQYDRELNKYNICRDHNILLIRIRENTERTAKDNCDVLLFASADINDTIKQLAEYIPGLKIIDYDAERDRNLIKETYISALKSGSLTHLDPELAKEWNYDKNTLGPEMYMAGSNEKVWWKCKLGHEWRTSIDSRHSRGTNCPYCSNNKVLPGFNDLQTVRPDLMTEWHPTRNTDLDPNALRPGSGKKAWWICKHGHEWKAEISSRNKGHGCPYCAGVKK